MRSLLLLLFLTLQLCALAAGKDYYELLGVPRDASVRDIRRAFKKLALELHPDKNPGDPDAHANFVQMNTAFEVLKDEETRKKYDAFGEAGLKQDGFQGQHYQGWQYYNEDFGLYDEDPQIATLTHADFFDGVLHSSEYWFVNFYSPGCSHCHDLAPVWRQLGQQLQGVVGVGAVNCHENWQLCNQMGIGGYPSLLFFHEAGSWAPHNGMRDLESLLAFVESFAPAVHPLDGPYLEELEHARGLRANGSGGDDVDGGAGGGRENGAKEEQHVAVAVRLSWLEDWDMQGLKLLSLALHPSVALRQLDCTAERVLCDARGYRESHVRFYAAGGGPAQGQQVYPHPDVFDQEDLLPAPAAKAVFAAFPELKPIGSSTLQQRIAGGRLARPTEKARALVLLFVGQNCQECDEALLTFRRLKLPASVQLRVVSCPDPSCTKYAHTQPALAMFKPGGHEIFHAQLRLGEVEKWVQAGLETSVVTLDPESFAANVQGGGGPWFVDFFAPWCPPCKAMLPHFRTASARLAPDVSLGTVDCTLHGSLCQQHGITHYPSLLLFNASSPPRRFSGGPDANQLVQFVDDVRNPVVEELTPDSFKARVLDSKDIVLVDFFAPWCGHCQELEPQLRDAARRLRGLARVGSVDCQQHAALCQQQGIGGYPTLNVYVTRSRRRETHPYQGMRMGLHIAAGVLAFKASKIVQLDANQYQRQVVPRAQPWLLSFGAPWCGPCHHFQPLFTMAANLLGTSKGLQFGYMDCQAMGHICQQLGVPHYPYVMLLTNHGNFQTGSQDPDEIVRWARTIVPPPPAVQHDEL